MSVQQTGRSSFSFVDIQSDRLLIAAAPTSKYLVSYWSAGGGMLCRYMHGISYNARLSWGRSI